MLAEAEYLFEIDPVGLKHAIIDLLDRAEYNLVLMMERDVLSLSAFSEIRKLREKISSVKATIIFNSKLP